MKRLASTLTILCILLLAALPCLAEAATPAADAAAPSVEATADPEPATGEPAAEEAPGNWFRTSTFTEKLAAVPWYAWLIVLALAALAAALFRAGKAQWDAKVLAYAAMVIAISSVLSAIKLFKMGQGGSVTPVSMLPVIAFALAFGPARGALVGCAYGLMQLLIDPSIYHPIQVVVDYPLAFAALALGGFAEKAPLPGYWKLPLAIVVGSLGRYLMAVLSGVVFFAEYAGDQNVLLYSLVYNITYLGPDALFCILIALIPGVARIVDTMKAAQKPV